MEIHTIQTIACRFSSGDYFLSGLFCRELTFEVQKEIQSEYYHSGQVSICFHVLYRYAQHNFDHIESTNDNRHLIKEYHPILVMTAHMIHIMYNIVLILFMDH